MKRSLYPKSFRNRLNFWAGVWGALFSIWATYSGDFGWAAFLAFAAVFNLVLVYIFQDQPMHGDSDEYTAVISQIKGIEEQLSELSGFLDRERKRVTDTESTLSKLREEKTKLEPVVSTNRQTVDAILAAHSARQRSNAWKERFIGFGFGILASMLASIVYGYFKQ